MTGFAVTAIAMLAAACAFVLVPMLRRQRDAAELDVASNLSVLRDQRRELEADRVHGVLSPEQYEIARLELDRRVLEEAGEPGKEAAASRVAPWFAAVVAGALPTAAALLYLTLGTPTALLPGGAAAEVAAQQRVAPQEIDTMIERVKERLASRPDDREGWRVLGRTYLALGRIPEAVATYERATTLIPDDADLLADYADALASSQNRSLEGKPAALIERALLVDATQWKANALAGTLAFERGDYAKAVEHWERVKRAMPADSPILASIDASLAEARSRAQTSKPSPSAKPGTGIAGTVSLSPSLAKGAGPDDTVFVFARPADGTRMPLALVRARVRDLPLSFTLDDSTAMIPDRKLSDHAEVVVGARVSRSGNATPQPGDLEATQKPAKAGARGIVIVIDRQLP